MASQRTQIHPQASSNYLLVCGKMLQTFSNITQKPKPTQSSAIHNNEVIIRWEHTFCSRDMIFFENCKYLHRMKRRSKLICYFRMNSVAIHENAWNVEFECIHSLVPISFLSCWTLTMTIAKFIYSFFGREWDLYCEIISAVRLIEIINFTIKLNCILVWIIYYLLIGL